MSQSAKPRVSVIIPARNEEANIEHALRSIAGQQGVLEIIVADDQSEDRTPAILERLKTEIPLLRTIRIGSLPEGWLGKSYAVQTAADQARGEWLLFTDADTNHLPGSLAVLLNHAEREHADLLSLSPGQHTPTWWEKSVIPLVYETLARLYPYEEVSNPRSAAAAANGQYILIRKSAYRGAGGHQTFRSEVLEDVALATRVKRNGGRLIFLLGAPWVETRMYQSFGGMWEGWTKNLYLLYGRRFSLMFSSMARILLLELAPAVALLVCLFLALRGRRNAIFFALAFLGINVWRQLRFAARLRVLRFDGRLARYRLAGSVLFSLLLLNSARAYMISHSVNWKGRSYPVKVAG